MNRRCRFTIRFILPMLILPVVLGANVAHAAKDKVVVAFGSNIPTLDPHMHSSRLAHIADWHLYDTLMDRDPKTYKPRPGLASSLKNLNPTTWEVKLRTGIKFHNGEPFNAEAVKFTLDRVLDPATKSVTRGNFTWIKEVKIIDDNTVHIITAKPFPAAAEFLTLAYIVPPKYVKAVGDEEFSRKPVGTGPYKFVEWKKAEHLILEANENYWKGSPKGMPKIKTIVFRTIPETTTQIAELLSGGVDIIRNVPPDQIDVIKNSPNARISATKILRVNSLLLDSAGRASKTPLMNQKVREAIAYAINVDEMLTQILGGYAERTATGVNPLHFGFDPSIKPYPYDPERARKLLTEAGYPNGFEITLNTYSGTITSMDQMADAVTGYLAKVGIKVKRRHIEDVGMWTSSGKEGKLEGIQYYSWGSNSIFDADAILYALTYSKEPLSYTKDATLDQYLDEGRTQIDPKKRLEAYAKAQKLLHEKFYWIPINVQYTIEGINKQLNYEAASDEMMRVYSASWKD
ncbi:MAG TPA: ABC transporter substrate-binding protein [Candidatus Methylomirabilis sp.]|nr:ABC transporter substrate-binding protein [Candidatus Methylomirabilis sp.]